MAAAVTADVARLSALSGAELHAALKLHGVAKIGIRQRVALMLANAPGDTLREKLRERLEAAGLREHVPTLCEQAAALVDESDPRALQAMLRKAGIVALGLRQRAALAIAALRAERAGDPATAITPTVKPADAGRARAPAPAAHVVRASLDESDEGSDGEQGEAAGAEPAWAGPEIEEIEEIEEIGDSETLASLRAPSFGAGVAEGGECELLLESNDRREDGGASPAVSGCPRGDADFELALIDPPELPPLVTAASEPLDAVDGARTAGINGSRRVPRRVLVRELLSLPGSRAEEEASAGGAKPGTSQHALQRIIDLTSNLHLSCAGPKLLDRRWRDGMHEAARRAGARRKPGPLGEKVHSHLSLDSLLDTLSARSAKVCVVGLGSGVPAIAAGKAGAEVLWLERVGRLAGTARRLVEENGLEGRVTVRLVEDWEEAKGAEASSFDACLTEEISDDLVGDGLLSIARLARRQWLKPSGTMLPSRAAVWGALASVRVKGVAGFDMRPWNVFRLDECVVYDLEQVLLNEAGCAELLSAPTRLLELDLNAPPRPAAPSSREIKLRAYADGILTCFVTWLEIETSPGQSVSFAPNRDSPRHMYSRAFKQRLFFTGHERRLRVGEAVSVRVTRSDEEGVSAAVPIDVAAERRRDLVRWPYAPVLSYHFPMIAEVCRNDKFERALLASIRTFIAANGGRRPRVLDIGSGTGLLAMMAARGGAAAVESVEMVPAVAAVARQIVARNGYADVVTVHTCRSDELSAAQLKGPADILVSAQPPRGLPPVGVTAASPLDGDLGPAARAQVSELIDDHLIGDGVLNSIGDARRRLLAPGAAVIPWGGRLLALPIQLRAVGPEGVSLDALNAERSVQVVLTRPYYAAKLQRLSPRDYRVLGPAVTLFEYDWRGEPIDTLTRERHSAAQPLAFDAAGVFNALALVFTLQMDEDASNDYSDGLDNPSTHWDQPIRFLPVEMRVAPGDRLRISATSNEHDVSQIRLSGATPEMVTGMVGAHGLLSSTAGARLGVVVDVDGMVRESGS